MIRRLANLPVEAAAESVEARLAVRHHSVDELPDDGRVGTQVVEAWVHHERGDEAAALSSLADALTFGRDLATATPVKARQAGHDCIVMACRRAQEILSSTTDWSALKGTNLVQSLNLEFSFVPYKNKKKVHFCTYSQPVMYLCILAQ